jgi:hypothetical protein
VELNVVGYQACGAIKQPQAMHLISIRHAKSQGRT